MKFLKITFFFIFLSSLAANSQTISKGEVIYKVNNQSLNIIKNDSVKKNIPKIKNLLKNEKKLEYILVFDKNLSFFSKKNRLENNKMNLTEIMAGKGSYYTDTSKESILLRKEAYGENFIVSLPTKKWQVTQISKKIGNYLCYKAITRKEIEGRWGKKILEITAWFTPEISVNFGPKEYNNLPGLILELNENGIVYTASKITLNSKKRLKISKPSSGKKVSIDEYNKISKEMYYKFKKSRKKN